MEYTYMDTKVCRLCWLSLLYSPLPITFLFMCHAILAVLSVELAEQHEVIMCSTEMMPGFPCQLECTNKAMRLC